LGNETSAAFESFQNTGHGEGLLDCPHWTRPADFRGWKAPDVLLSGNHEEIRQFRKDSALEKTARLRPDLLANVGQTLSSVNPVSGPPAAGRGGQARPDSYKIVD
jgi:tRNA (guanine37-N1)-methyltransferase